MNASTESKTFQFLIHKTNILNIAKFHSATGIFLKKNMEMIHLASVRTNTDQPFRSRLIILK